MKNSYLPELDGIRAISILLVLATHLLPVGPKSLHLNSMTGLMGMSLFFCLSGFLITRFLYESPRISTFLTRRIARIIPLLLLYAFLVAGLMFQRWDSFAGIMLFYLNYSDSLIFKGISHLWSICIEFHFYLSIAFLVLLFGRRGFWAVPAAALIVLAMRIDAGAYSTIRTHLRVDEILSGSLLALAWLNQGHPLARRLKSLLSRAFVPALLLWMLSSHEIGGPLNYARPYLAMGVVGSVLFMAEGRVRRACRLGALRYIAHISYALYVWHPMTALGWMSEGDRWTLYLFKRPVSFLATFFLAHVSTNTLERYFTRLVRRTTARSGETVAG